MTTDPDLSVLFAELPPELVAELSANPDQPTKPDRQAKQSIEFFLARLPYNLTRAQALGAPFAVLMELQHVYFRKGINPVPLGNKNLEAVGVGRKRKMRALIALKNAGYISFTCDGKSFPEVTLHWLLLQKHSLWKNATV